MLALAVAGAWEETPCSRTSPTLTPTLATLCWLLIVEVSAMCEAAQSEVVVLAMAMVNDE